MSQPNFLRIVSFALILPLAACGGGSGSSAGGGAGSSAKPAALHGTVHGGQSGLVGSAVAVYAVDNPVPLVTATTGAGGAFTANFTCPSTTALIYATAQGGYPGGDGSQNNTAISLESGIGPCGSLPSFVNVDELSTVATAYALNAFHNGSGIASSGNTVGVSNAFATVALLVDVASGSPAGTLPDASACSSGSPPANCLTVQRLDALANSVAACVNSTGPTSAECTELFDCATLGASFSSGACTAGGTAATDTLHAALNVVQNPGTVSIAGIYDVATRDVVFSPTLVAAPTDWTLSINYTDPSFNAPWGLAIDAAGDAWVTNSAGNSVTELGPTGTVLSGAGYTGGGLNTPNGIAIDANGYVWIADDYNYNFIYPSGTITELNSAGQPQSAVGYSSGTSPAGATSPMTVAVDQSGNVWVVDASGEALAELYGSSSSTPGAQYPNSPYAGGGTYAGAQYLAIDGGGNVWVSDYGYDISEYLPASGWVNSGGFFNFCGLYEPAWLAVDQKGNVWIANQFSSVVELDNKGDCLSGSGYTGGGLYFPVGLAIDGAGNVWVSNLYGNSITEIEGASGSSPGAALSPADASAYPPGPGFTGAGLNEPNAVAIDSSGNLWIPNESGNSVTEFIGAAAPVKTPMIGPPQAP